MNDLHAYHITPLGDIKRIVPKTGDAFDIKEIFDYLDGFALLVQLTEKQVMFYVPDAEEDYEENLMAEDIVRMIWKAAGKGIPNVKFYGDVIVCPTSMMPV